MNTDLQGSRLKGTRLLLTIAVATAALPGCTPTDVDPLFLAYGRLFAVDPGAARITDAGRLHPAAVSMAIDTRGLVWGRVAPASVGAVSPGPDLGSEPAALLSA